MKAMKLAVAYSDRDAAVQHAECNEGVLFTSTSDTTSHLPFAALFVGATDDLDGCIEAGDAGVYLVCERAIRNKPLSLLEDSELPVATGLFAMVANSAIGATEADQHWRDRHAPLALEVHTTMTHYYQLAVVHRFSGASWHGIAACCCATENHLRHQFYGSKEGERRIFEDIRVFADTTQSPRRVIATARRFRG